MTADMGVPTKNLYSTKPMASDFDFKPTFKVQPKDTDIHIMHKMSDDNFNDVACYSWLA